jgi:WD40 repeat protein/DNA-binding SARP family transcriptional activator
MTASRLEFRILGPLTVRVDGAAVPTGGPKQRALLALLLLSANRVVSRERLIGELFAEQSPNSADHALRNHVSRLRKLLAPAAVDEPRLVARAPGYLLRVEPGELDLEHFERHLAAGRESLAAGEATAAAESLRAAERIWQGRPLADLELEPFARVEVERLEELRLAAVEERIDAELALGRQLALVPELESLTAEYPYRERFRAQQMLALYRCGRQAEGLEVYRRTRSLLYTELGLEPGLELQELERAILVQDPALIVSGNGHTGAAAPLREMCPFKGLAPFEAADAELFFGRERLVDELTARLASTPVLAIVGASGSGKSSLLSAGLLPALGLQTTLVRPGDRAAVELSTAFEHAAAGERIVLAVDQFEEVFADSLAESHRRALVDVLVEAAWDPDRRALILIALRADFFGRLASYVELADLVGPNHVLLGAMSPTELRRAIEGPAGRVGLQVEPVLADALVHDLAGEVGALPLLSTSLLDLWHGRDGRTLTLGAYERSGGVRDAVGHYAEATLRLLDPDEQKVARRIILRLVAGSGDSLTRRRPTRAELDADEDEPVARVLAKLVEHRLIVADDGTVELVHEALLEHWPRLREWLDEDADGRRLHRHLMQAASEWAAGGRDDADLYRGARLGATLEWADLAGDQIALNRLEREFLRESRTAFARANRRLRALLALAGVLIAAALVAGGIALVERDSARRQANAATAQRLGAQALIEPRLDRSLLLAREGRNLDDSLATRSNLLAALLRSPAAIAVLRATGTRVVDDSLSPDGRTLAVRGNDGIVTFFDTRLRGAVGSRLRSPPGIGDYGNIVRPARALAFSPDGRTLAVGDGDGSVSTLLLVNARSRRVRAALSRSGTGTIADITFSPDGRTLVTGDPVAGPERAPGLELVARSAVDGRPIRRSAPIPAGRLIGYAEHGRSLLVTSGETRSYLVDPRTFQRVRTFPLAGAAALPPHGEIAAFGQDDGAVTILDLASGAERSMRQQATGRVTALAFSADGRTLASASDDGSIDIWDVPGATLRETFTGPAAPLGLLFSLDGTTLYAGSGDGSVIAWDVSGTRRLGQPFRFAPEAERGAGPHSPAPDATTSVAVSPDGVLFATSPGPGRVTIWRTRNQTLVRALHGPHRGISALAWSHGGGLIAATGADGHTVVWNVATGKIVKVLGHGGKWNLGVAFSPDDRLVATAGEDGLLRVYNLATGRLVVGVQVRGTLQDLDFSPDGSRVAAAGLAGEIVIWNLARHTLERKIHDNQLILAIRFSPNGMRIATGDVPGAVDFWDVATGRPVGHALVGDGGPVTSVAFDPTGTQVVTASGDGKIRLWDLASGKLVGAPLPGSDTRGFGTFLPNGKRVIAVFADGTGVVWTVDPAAWAAQACRVANRNLTPSEWRDLLPQRGYRPVCP